MPRFGARRIQSSKNAFKTGDCRAEKVRRLAPSLSDHKVRRIYEYLRAAGVFSSNSNKNSWSNSDNCENELEIKREDWRRAKKLPAEWIKLLLLLHSIISVSVKDCASALGNERSTAFLRPVQFAFRSEKERDRKSKRCFFIWLISFSNWSVKGRFCRRTCRTNHRSPELSRKAFHDWVHSVHYFC